MTVDELDEILTLEWPRVLRRVMADLNADEFAKGFARSIQRHGKRLSWRPTPRQERIMRQMLRDYSGPPEPEVQLIEKA